jgi:hypothetical protein
VRYRSLQPGPEPLAQVGDGATDGRAKRERSTKLTKTSSLPNSFCSLWSLYFARPRPGLSWRWPAPLESAAGVSPAPVRHLHPPPGLPRHMVMFENTFLMVLPIVTSTATTTIATRTRIRAYSTMPWPRIRGSSGSRAASQHLRNSTADQTYLLRSPRPGHHAPRENQDASYRHAATPCGHRFDRAGSRLLDD